jgi:hypothetical protein
MPAAFTRSLQNGTTNATRRGGRLTAPLIVGLLNGLMPCGPLQAMQIFALSTGSPLNGAAAMFFFALGTVPLMFTLGAVSSWMSKKFTRTVLQIGSVVVAVFGLVMLTTGLSLSGVRLPGAIAGATTGTGELARIEGSGATAVQTVTTTLASGRYQPITVQVGIPVRWTVTATDADINGCNGSIIIPAYNVEHDFHPGDNLIEFTPDRPGTYVYTCWMGMISSTITVLDENGREVKGSEDAQTNLPDATGAAVAGAAGCPCCDGAAGTAE